MKILIGIVIMGLFVMYVIKKGKKQPSPEDSYQEQRYWEEKQEEYDHVTVVDDNGSDDD
jgi:hypothetical protein